MTNNSITLTGAKARKKILNGVKVVYDTVKLTLGPGGKNAILPRTFNRGPRNTNDGVTISENIMLKDIHERIAADFFKEGAKRTNERGGDGTSSTVVIGGHLVAKIFSELPDETIPQIGHTNTNVMNIKREMKEQLELVITEIKKQTKPIKTLEDLRKIAFISTEDDECADIISKMVWELGVDNYIDITEGYKGIIETETDMSMRFPAKVPAPAFVNKPERHEMVAEETKVLITNYKIDDPYEIATVLNSLKLTKVAIIATDFSSNVLISFVQGIKNGVSIFPIKAPSYRTVQLEDLAVATGATVIDKDKGMKLEQITEEHLGFADKIVVKEVEHRENATLIGGKGQKSQAVKERVKILKGQMEEARNNTEKEQLRLRIANLQAATGIIRVGHKTDAELLYTKLKIEDGVNACKSALEEGYVKGGGLCLKEIAETLPKNILTESLKAPYEQIQHNAGGIKIGKDVIDPTKVVRLAVEHAVSIASQLITTDILIAEEQDKTPAEGYEAIARAINTSTYFTAKHSGMIKENEMEAEKDRAKAWEEVMINDHD